MELMLSDILGKKVEVNFQTVNSQRQFEESYVDLSQIIHMDIDEEEE